MIIVNTDIIAGKKIVKHLGLVRGNSVRARHIGIDFMAQLRNFVGGEVVEYSKMLAETREQALDRMVEQALELEADAVINVRFSTSQIMKSAAELVAYGTAVKLVDE